MSDVSFAFFIACAVLNCFSIFLFLHAKAQVELALFWFERAERKYDEDAVLLSETRRLIEIWEAER